MTTDNETEDTDNINNTNTTSYGHKKIYHS